MNKFFTNDFFRVTLKLIKNNEIDHNRTIKHLMQLISQPNHNLGMY